MEDLTPAQCFELLRSEQVGHIAVISDGEPYVTPISYVVSNSDIAMRVGDGRRVRAIEENPRASFEVSQYDTETGDWKSVIIQGNLRVATEDHEIQSVIAGLLAKYRPVVSALRGGQLTVLKDVVLILHIEEMTGRTSGSFFALRSRPGRL